MLKYYAYFSLSLHLAVDWAVNRISECTMPKRRGYSYGLLPNDNKPEKAGIWFSLDYLKIINNYMYFYNIPTPLHNFIWKGRVKFYLIETEGEILF